MIPVYYTQRDNTRGQASRSCFSACCAMVVATYRRDQGKTAQAEDPNWDDEYLKRVNVYGDSTDSGAQIQALKYYGLDAKMRVDCDFAVMSEWIRAGELWPCGMLHHGHVSKPSGGGHYVLPYELLATSLMVHDPFGEQDLVNGGFIPASGKSVLYSRKNFGPRWMVGGGKTGWALRIRRPS